MHVLHILTLGVALAAETVVGHMNMADPPPLRYKGNPNAVKAGKVDSDITSPNTAATFPCKGALPDLDDPVAGAPVATWYPGEQHTVQIVGGASHNGGSCQLSLSYDKGQTFTVVFSKIGACPSDPNIPFTLPADTPSADKVLFSWSWINHTGNREFYNNCAVLTIGAAKKKRAAPAVAFKDRPPMLVADIYHVAGAACVKEGVDALYPEPGPDFVNVSSSAALPDDCVSGQPLSANPVVGGSGGSAGAPGGSGSGSASGAAPPAGPGVTSSSPLGGGVAPTSVYVPSPSASASASSMVLLHSSSPARSMFSSLLLPLPPPSSLLPHISISFPFPTSAVVSSALASASASSEDGKRKNTLVTSTRSASVSTTTESAGPSSLIVIPITTTTTSRRNHTTTTSRPSRPSPTTTFSSFTSASRSTIVLISSSSLSPSPSPGGGFITSSRSSTISASLPSSLPSSSSSSSTGSGVVRPTTTTTNAPTTTSRPSNSIPSGVSPPVSAPPAPSATSSNVVGVPSASASRSSTVAIAPQPSSTGSPGSGSGGGAALSGPCTPEGEWNCLTGGQSWQRCASGLWSAVMPMAAGTQCTPGQSANLSMGKRGGRRGIKKGPVRRRDPVRRAGRGW